jgi:hypothetical protein
MSEQFRDVKLRNVGDYLMKNFKFGLIPRYIGQGLTRYQNKYVNVKNAKMTPFFHFMAGVVLLNYMIDYKYNLKYEKNRKYH